MAGRAGSGEAAKAAIALGHDFALPELLEQAITHPSAAGPARQHNQRLEFLGDRVLGLVMAEALSARRPDEAEGALAPRLNELVRKETCAEVARDIGLDGLVRLGRSEALTGGRRKTAILGDAMEALIAAVYLDAGLEAARGRVLAWWGGRIDAQGAAAPQDAKTALQEWAQARGMAPPAYREIARSGPDHAPRFTIRAELADGAAAEATAGAKRAAEQDAAARLLARLEGA